LAIARAAVPGGVAGAIVTEATPFLNEAGRDGRVDAGARTPRIFPRRIDSSKSDGAGEGVEFFLEMRNESGLSGTTWKDVESFSETNAAVDNRESSARAGGVEEAGCVMVETGTGSRGLAETGRLAGAVGAGIKTGFLAGCAWRTEHPESVAAKTHPTNRNFPHRNEVAG